MPGTGGQAEGRNLIFSMRYRPKISRFARNDKFKRLFTNSSIITAPIFCQILKCQAQLKRDGKTKPIKKGICCQHTHCLSSSELSKQKLPYHLPGSYCFSVFCISGNRKIYGREINTLKTIIQQRTL